MIQKVKIDWEESFYIVAMSISRIEILRQYGAMDELDKEIEKGLGFVNHIISRPRVVMDDTDLASHLGIPENQG